MEVNTRAYDVEPKHIFSANEVKIIWLSSSGAIPYNGNKAES